MSSMTSTSLSHKEDTALQAYVQILDARFGPRLLEVLLFGSKARSEARPDSDIDVAVILDQPSPQDPVSYTHLRAHETVLDIVCRLLLEKKKRKRNNRSFKLNHHSKT